MLGLWQQATAEVVEVRSSSCLLGRSHPCANHIAHYSSQCKAAWVSDAAAVPWHRKPRCGATAQQHQLWPACSLLHTSLLHIAACSSTRHCCGPIEKAPPAGSHRLSMLPRRVRAGAVEGQDERAAAAPASGRCFKGSRLGSRCNVSAVAAAAVLASRGAAQQQHGCSSIADGRQCERCSVSLYHSL